MGALGGVLWIYGLGLVFLGATLLLYALVFLRPGDPVAGLGGERGLPEAVQQQIRAQFHLDQPFIVQYLYFLKGIFTFDGGLDYALWKIKRHSGKTVPVTDWQRRHPLPERIAKVSLRHAADEAPELDHDRVVQPQPLAARSADLVSHTREGG